MSVAESYASGRSGSVNGIRASSRLVQRRLVSFVCAVAAFPLALFSATNDPPGAESSPPPTASQLEQTNSQALLHSYLQLQEQVRTTQLAIEQNRQETRKAAAQTAEALSNALQTVQEAFAAHRARDLEAMQSSNKIMLIVVGTFAAMSFLSMLMMSYFQWRMSKGLAEISAALPTAVGLGPGSAAPLLGPAQESYLPLPETAEQREWRIHTQERRPHPAAKPTAPANRPILNPLLPDAGFWRRRQLRTWRTVLIVGLICAAALALVLYMVTYRKLGLGYFHGVFNI
jgi:hypothetical protein